MFEVSAQIEFCYGHRLLNYEGKCKHLHGHNAVVELSMQAEQLDQRGMVWDFHDIKKALQQWINNNLDHRMILQRHDPLVAFLQEVGEPCFLMDDNPTAENLARMLYEQSKALGLPVHEVRFWETPSTCASWRGE